MENWEKKRQQSGRSGEEVQHLRSGRFTEWETEEQSAYQPSKDISLGLEIVRLCLKRFKRMKTQQGTSSWTTGGKKQSSNSLKRKRKVSQSGR